MIMRRLVFALLILAAPIAAFAQNDFGIWANTSQYKSSSFSEAGAGTAELEFKSQIGYGVSFNHFSGPNMSTEYGFHQLKSDINAHFRLGNINESARLGTFKANQLTGVIKWHFMPRSFIVPYLGAGGAYFTGGEVRTVNDPRIGETGETFKMENKFGLLLNGGVNFSISPRMMIGLDVRRASYTAREKGAPSTEDLDLNPTTISLGLRLRM